MFFDRTFPAGGPLLCWLAGWVVEAVYSCSRNCHIVVYQTLNVHQRKELAAIKWFTFYFDAMENVRKYYK